MLGNYIDLLAFLLTTHGEELLTRLILIRCTHGPRMLLDILLVSTVHLLEDAKVLEVLALYSRQQGIIIGCVLIVVVIPHNDQQYFFHVVDDGHGPRASVHHLLEAGLVGPRIESTLEQLVVDLVRILVALFERGVICAYENHPKVDLLEADVDVEHILLGAPWNANGRPCLTILHRWVCHDKVEYHLYV